MLALEVNCPCTLVEPTLWRQLYRVAKLVRDLSVEGQANTLAKGWRHHADMRINP